MQTRITTSLGIKPFSGLPAAPVVVTGLLQSIAVSLKLRLDASLWWWQNRHTLLTRVLWEMPCGPGRRGGVHNLHPLPGEDQRWLGTRFGLRYAAGRAVNARRVLHGFFCSGVTIATYPYPSALFCDHH